MPEVKPVLGYEGRYSVDDTGVIYTARRRGTSGGILPQRLNSSGYYRVDLQDGNKKRSVFVHRIVAEAFIAMEPGRDFVNHKDGNKLNNHVDNLEWCTRSENINHAYKNGLMHEVHPSGEQHTNSKVTDEEAITIYQLYRTGVSGIQIGKMFNVGKNVAYRIVNGKRKLSNGMTVKQYIEINKRDPNHGALSYSDVSTGRDNINE